jgi:glycosyltransferase involved in cell wall biosynthesis
VKICQLAAVDFTMYRMLLPLCLAMKDAGHEVVAVCSPGPLLDRVEAAGIRCRPVPIERSMDPLAQSRAARALTSVFRDEGFDMVHAHTPVASLVGRWAAWRAGVPRIVYTAHGFYFHDRMPWAKRALFIALEWLAGRVTDVLFTQSQEDAWFARRHRLTRATIVEAIGNGVDAGRFHPGDGESRQRMRADLQTPDGAVVVMMVGRLVAEKGYPELFRAMAGLDAHLWVAGDRLASDHADAIDGALAEVAANPSLKRRVHLLGQRDDIADLLRAADIFTLPSHREGMPRSIIEAMMTGLPVVASDIRGCREEVADGETGLLVPAENSARLKDALGRLIGDAELRRAMGSAGRERAAALYDENQVIRRQLELLGLTSGPVP